MGKKKNFWNSLKKPKATSLPDNSHRKETPAKKAEATNSEATAISTDSLPLALADQIEALIKLEKKILHSNELAKTAKLDAENASKRPTGLFGRRRAVEALQKSALRLSQAQEDVWDAVLLFYHHQQELSKVIAQLYIDSTSSSESVTIAIKQFEDALTGNEIENYSEETIAELKRIAKKLSDNESIVGKLARHGVTIQENSASLQEHGEHLQILDNRHIQTEKEVQDVNKLATSNRKDIGELVRKQQDLSTARQKSEKREKITLAVAAIAAILAFIQYFI